jgi:hypothetical protein
MCERKVKGVIIVEMRKKEKGENARMRRWQWERSHYIKSPRNVVSNVL